MAGLPEHIERLISESVEERDLYLLEIIRRGHQNSTVLEVIVDSEQGVDLDRLAELSRTISSILDEHEEAVKGRYRLEVSTPGLDRPLEHGWQYRKNIGRLVKVTWQDQEKGKQTQLFRLLNVSDEDIELAAAKNSKGKKKGKANEGTEPLALSFNRIERITVEPEI